MTDHDFDRVAEAFRGSLVYRISRATVERATVAADESAASRRWRGIEQSYVGLTAQQYVASVAITIAVAALAHLAIRELLPRYATSGLPWWWHIAGATFAAMVAMLSGPIAMAWHDSSIAKILRRFSA